MDSARGGFRFPALSLEDQHAIRTFYRAFSGEPDLLDQVVTPDWQGVPVVPGQAPGRDGIKAFVKRFTTAFPDAQVRIHEIVGSSGSAGVRAEIAGTHTGEWFGKAPTGLSFRLVLHEFHHLENGRLTRTWHFEDWFRWLSRLGSWQTQRQAA